MEKAAIRIKEPVTLLDIYTRPHLIQGLMFESEFASIFAEYALRFDDGLFVAGTNAPMWLFKYLKSMFKEFFVQ
jgi:hypothetical protein